MALSSFYGQADFDYQCSGNILQRCWGELLASLSPSILIPNRVRLCLLLRGRTPLHWSHTYWPHCPSESQMQLPWELSNLSFRVRLLVADSWSHCTSGIDWSTLLSICHDPINFPRSLITDCLSTMMSFQTGEWFTSRTDYSS